jgi:serine/threonine protein kinase
VDFGLVKVLSPGDDRTITVLQGRGTAAYTPLEQYGGDVGHTDVRSDIYSLGATIYHLLTHQSPIDAKQRFLHPEALATPTELNPHISSRVEQAILHALALHPTHRPSSIAAFKAELLGTPPQTNGGTLPPEPSRWVAVFARNRVMVMTCLVLLVLALMVTLLAPQVVEPSVMPTIQPTTTRLSPLSTR